jgi:hypothetical protein
VEEVGKWTKFFPFNYGLNGVIIINDERILLGKILRFIKVFMTVEYLLIRQMPAERSAGVLNSI